MIISFEGMDGSGKSTQLQMFQAVTQAIAIPQYNSLPKIYPNTMRVELFKRVEELRLELARMICPTDALVRLGEQLSLGRVAVLHPYDIVLLDRSVDTTYVYSPLFFRKDVEAAQLDHDVKIGRWHQKASKPDLTFLLTTNYQAAKERLQEGWSKSDRRLDQEFDMMPEELWTDTYQRYLTLSGYESDRIIRIDANQSPDAVHADIMAAYRQRLQEITK